MLFGEDHDDGDVVIEAHRWLNAELPLTEEMFERSLEILDTTLDTGWRGPHTEQIRRRGYGLAWAMAHRLAGVKLARPAWAADG